ncbi:MAG: hypothetical protein AAF204_02660 [Pseudomonadota bacterium]
MIANFKKQKQETNASARVVDGKMILSMPDALAPVVWQMDLSEVKASALELRHDEKTERFVLVLKTPRGEKNEIAGFDKRTHALEALMAASAALENAHGSISNASHGGQIPSSPAQNAKTKRGKWMSALLGIVILFILLVLWSSIMPNSVNTGTGGTTSTALSAGGSAPQSGMPLSADDFLSQQ